MEELQIGDQVIRFDRQLTQTGCASLRRGWAEECDCESCRNFAAQRESAFPVSFHLLLERLGIDVTKEAEVYDSGRDDNGVTYEGWFYFAGVVIQAGERLTGDGDSFHYFFRDASASDALQMFGKQVAAVEFETKIPWLRRESEQ
jgi:hypothetical protein